jgi:hypothetical protein
MLSGKRVFDSLQLAVLGDGGASDLNDFVPDRVVDELS